MKRTNLTISLAPRRDEEKINKNRSRSRDEDTNTNTKKYYKNKRSASKDSVND